MRTPQNFISNILIVAAVAGITFAASMTIPPPAKTYCQIGNGKLQPLKPGCTIWMNTNEQIRITIDHDIKGFDWKVLDFGIMSMQDNGVKLDPKASTITLLDDGDHEVLVLFSGKGLLRSFRFWINNRQNHTYFFYRPQD